MKATKVKFMFLNRKKRKKQEELKKVIKLLSQLNNKTSTVRKHRHNPSFKIPKALWVAVRFALIFGPIIGWAEPVIAEGFEDLEFEGNEIDISEIDPTVLDSLTDILESLDDLDFDELYLNVEYIDVSDLTLDELQSARCNIELVLRNL
ncbi:hypothetical protein [Okeania sp. SIO1F9]|uniref:hypothetical protein n=1 Tax=Okeania sp. SIO1F9 TaxID=2607813 RepID=UPI00144F4992|nr:hypothetical protein [Okeania sp. SIO1F9]NET76722.1 hypothetical protein [Okeania sp. SIO1F9]